MTKEQIGIILGAGYGTRLKKGIEEDASGKYKHLLQLPKPLVPIQGDHTIVDIWLNILKKQANVK
eukprot:Pgem_evm1s18325